MKTVMLCMHFISMVEIRAQVTVKTMEADQTDQLREGSYFTR